MICHHPDYGSLAQLAQPKAIYLSRRRSNQPQDDAEAHFKQVKFDPQYGSVAQLVRA